MPKQHRGEVWLVDLGHDRQSQTLPRYQLSFKFLHIFEENPNAWNAVRKMPAYKRQDVCVYAGLVRCRRYAGQNDL